MLQSQELRNELQSLKRDFARPLGTAGEDTADASSGQAAALTEQIKTALRELAETVGYEEDRIGEIISDRPITTLASAFALGVVVGFALTRT